MTLEEALIEIGDQPLSKSQYSQAILSVVRARTTSEESGDVTRQTPGYVVLGIVYKLQNVEIRDKILSWELKPVRSADLYRQLVVFCAAILVFFAVLISTLEISSTVPISDQYSGLFKTALEGFFEIVKIVLTDKAPSP